MARFLSLALLVSLALVCLGQLEAVAAGCGDAMGDDGPSIGNFYGRGRELSQCVREYRQKYGKEFQCGKGLRGKTCVQIKDHFQSFVDDLRLCLAGPTTAAPTTTPLPNPKDCKDVFDRGQTGDIVTTIFPDGQTEVSVRCIDGATVIVNRDSYGPGFNKTFSEFAAGFGARDGDYYLGNDVIHTLTSSGNYKLRVDIVRPGGTQQFAEYTTFLVGPASDKYKLTVDGYSGNAGDAMTINNGLPFNTEASATTNDVSSTAGTLGGGWWFPDFLYLVLTTITTASEVSIYDMVWGATNGESIVSGRMALERQ